MHGWLEAFVGNACHCTDLRRIWTRSTQDVLVDGLRQVFVVCGRKSTMVGRPMTIVEPGTLQPGNSTEHLTSTAAQNVCAPWLSLHVLSSVVFLSKPYEN